MKKKILCVILTLTLCMPFIADLTALDAKADEEVILKMDGYKHSYFSVTNEEEKEGTFVWDSYDLHYLGDKTSDGKDLLNVPATVKCNGIEYRVKKVDLGYDQDPWTQVVNISEGIEEVAFAKNVYIKENYLSNVESINLPLSIKKIEGIISNAKSLEQLTIGGEKVNSNGSYFVDNGVLYNQDKTDLLTYIPTLEGDSFSIPRSVKNIKAGAFAHSKNLKSMIIPDSVSKMEEVIFCGSSVEKVNLSKNLDILFSDTFSDSNIENLDLSNIKELNGDSFYKCKRLKAIKFGKDTKFTRSKSLMGNMFFSDNPSLETITVPDGNPYLYSKNNVLYGKVGGENQYSILCYPEGKNDAEYTVEYGTDTVERGAFSNCINLKKVTLPNTVQKIKSKGFNYEELTDEEWNEFEPINIVISSAGLSRVNANSLYQLPNNSKVSLADQWLVDSVNNKNVLYTKRNDSDVITLGVMDKVPSTSLELTQTGNKVILTPDGRGGYTSSNETAQASLSSGSTDSVTFKSSDPDIAEVDANGTVTAKKAGNVTVTATTDSGLSKNIDFAAVQDITDDKNLTVSHKKSYIYTGYAIEPKDMKVKAGTTLLKEGTDYTLSFEKNTDIGTATAIIHGIGNYTGTYEENFTIGSGSLDDATITIDTEGHTYTSEEIRPQVHVVYDGRVLEEEVDYKVIYQNNIEAGNGKVIVAGINAFGGSSLIKAFQIHQADISNASVAWTGSNYFDHPNSAVHPTNFEVRYQGRLLERGKDYTVAYHESYNGASADYASNLDIIGKGNYAGQIMKALNYYVYDSNRKPGTPAAPATRKNITSVKTSSSVLTYNGRNRTVGLNVYCGNTKLTYNKDYTVRYQNNKNCGKASVTVYGTGSYAGSRTVTFKIIPKKASLKKVSAAKKSAKVTINKSGGSVSGYQIRYSADKKFKKSKYKTTAKTSYKLTKLKSKKYVYVKVRAYKIIDGKKCYGSWSGSKKVKVK